MTTSANSNNQSLLRDTLYAARYYLGGRTGILVIATIGLGAGAYFNWGWLVAAGIAPLIITVLPCAAMCALGLCMGGKTHKAAEAGDDSVVSSLPSKKTSKAKGKTDKECC